MLAISILAGVAALGTYLNYAITHGIFQFGPVARVLVGLVIAGAIGAWGLWLRKTERSFGSTLVGLALVILQVCAYAAGPSFHLVPVPVAFAVAVIASWAIAMFAHREEDEPLWCVGFGGAALAPFVTSDGHGNVIALALFAAILLPAACFALTDRDWPVAWRVFYASSALLCLGTGAAASEHRSLPNFLVALSLPFLVLAIGVVPYTSESRKRGALRWMAMLALLAGAMSRARWNSDDTLSALAFSTAALAWLALVDRHAEVPQSSGYRRWREELGFLDALDAAFLPIGFALVGARSLAMPLPQVTLFLWVALACAAFAWRRTPGALRDAGVGAGMLLAAAAIAVSPLEGAAQVGAFVVLALVAARAQLARPSRGWIGGGMASGVIAITLALSMLLDRDAWHFTPFATEASLASLAALAGLVIVRAWHREPLATRVAPWLWAFTWIMVELAMAISPSASVLLLVTYFAITAVACVAAGRARDIARLRQVGLVLAFASAAAALYGATTYFDEAARIGAYLVTSVFLLGIAFWYRRAGNEPRAG